MKELSVNTVRGSMRCVLGYLLAKVWELETVSTPGELRGGREVEKQKIDQNVTFKGLHMLEI